MRFIPRSLWFWHYLPVALIALGGWAMLGGFEIFGDDFVESRMAMENWELLRSLLGFAPPIADPKAHLFYDLEYYGVLFNLVPYGLFQLISPGADVIGFASLHFKQGCVWAVAIATSLLLIRALYALYPSRFAGIAVLVALLTQPYYSGHAFGDMKDIGFAFGITLTSLIAARWGVWLSTALHSDTRTLWRGSLRYGLCIGMAIGIASCSRVGGVALFGWVAVIGILIATQQKTICRAQSWIAGCLTAFMAAGCGFLMIWFGHPVAYGDPVSWLIETIAYHSHHPNVAQTLTNGEWIASTDTSWRYVLLWFAAKTPPIIAALALMGCGECIRRAIARHDPAATAYGTAFGLQAVLFVTIAMLAGAHLYMGVRQLLMVLPAIAFFSAYGLMVIWQKRHTSFGKWLLIIAAILLAETGMNMAQLHPYYVNYFSPYFRSSDMHERWTLFYDGKQSVKWLREQGILGDADKTRLPAIPDTPLYTNAYSGALIALYAGLFESVVQRASYDAPPTQWPHYFIEFNRMRFRYAATPDCHIIHRTEIPLGRQMLHLGSIYYCDNAIGGSP